MRHDCSPAVILGLTNKKISLSYLAEDRLMVDVTDLDAYWEFDEICDECDKMLLEPKTVSGWLGLPGSQLPRETAKIIGQPAQPARKKGSSAKYSFQDATLMKLGRTLMELGITPHRVRTCIEAVRKHYHNILFGYVSLDVSKHATQEFDETFYLVGAEYPNGFLAFIITEGQLPEYLTASGIKRIEWREAIRVAMLERMKALKSNLPKFDLSMLRPGRPEDYVPPEMGIPESLKARLKARPDEDLDKLAEEGYGLIERRDPGSPAIVQNVSQYLVAQSCELYRYLKLKERSK
jgi:hypothetical protein